MRAEITGLVVDEARRCRGVARELVIRIKAWVLQQDLKQISVKSGVHRTAAQLFYQQQGFQLAKTRRGLMFEYKPGAEDVLNRPADSNIRMA